MQARIRGIELFFDVAGAAIVEKGGRLDERLSALLNHGGPGSDHISDKLRYGVLAEKMQLIFFDMRGHGRSARCDPSTYTLDENVEDLEALRQYLGLGPVVSIGTSYGGRVAMAHAARYPTAVSHLVLVATSAHAESAARALDIARERGTPEQVAVCEDLYAGRIDTPDRYRRYLEITAPLYSHTHESRRPSRTQLSILEPEPLNRAYGPGGFMWDLDLRPELGRIAAPTLIIAGRHDWRCAPEYSEELHRLIPCSDLRIFENSAHSVAVDEPEKLIDTIAGFLVYNTPHTR